MQVTVGTNARSANLRTYQSLCTNR